jgi:hypothetical protein
LGLFDDLDAFDQSPHNPNISNPHTLYKNIPKVKNDTCIKYFCFAFAGFSPKTSKVSIANYLLNLFDQPLTADQVDDVIITCGAKVFFV